MGNILPGSEGFVPEVQMAVITLGVRNTFVKLVDDVPNREQLGGFLQSGTNLVMSITGLEGLTTKQRALALGNALQKVGSEIVDDVVTIFPDEEAPA